MNSLTLRPFTSLLFSMSLALIGCSAVQPIENSSGQSSLLELQVEPTTAQIYLDDSFHGHVEGWQNQTLPIPSGHRRLELRAPGYLPQRFDLDVSPGEHLVLRTRLEKEIETFDDAPTDEVESSPSTLQPPPLPRRGTQRDW